MRGTRRPTTIVTPAGRGERGTIVTPPFVKGTDATSVHVLVAASIIRSKTEAVTRQASLAGFDPDKKMHRAVAGVRSEAVSTIFYETWS
jgi:hypothetical protein